MCVCVMSLDSLCRWQIQVSVYCARRIPAHLRCTQCSILLHTIQWLGRKKSQWANGPMLTQINGPFQISMGHGIKCMGHQWVSISKTCICRKQDKHNINIIL